MEFAKGHEKHFDIVRGASRLRESSRPRGPKIGGEATMDAPVRLCWGLEGQNLTRYQGSCVVF